MRRPRTNPRLARARHLAQVEAAVRRYAPEVWTATRRLHAKWLREALAAARPLLDRLVIEARLYELEVEWLSTELAWLGYEISPDELLQQPEVIWTLRRLATTTPRQAGFLTTDPRLDTLVRETVRILEDDLSTFWRTLTDPETLARRLVALKAEGVPYVEASRQVARQYGTEFYRAERLVRSSYNTAANNAAAAALEEAGFTKKRWLTSRDARVRRPTPGSPYDHASADGQTVPVDQPFIVSGEPLMYPGDRSRGASAGNLINCRCSVIGVE
ncbi:MAG TPA: hypothetical protein VF202_11980 [Trueperaceae bacterium]